MTNYCWMSNYDRWDYTIPPWVARKLDLAGLTIDKEIPNDYWDEIVDFPIKKMIRTGKYCATIFYHGQVGTTDTQIGRSLKWSRQPIVKSSVVDLHPDKLRNYIGTPEDWQFTAKVIKLKTIGYEGIKEQYPRINKRVGGLISLFRPFTLVAPILIGIFGVLIERTVNGGPFSWLTVLLAGICLALCQAIGQVSNQLTDINIDQINKPYRPLPSGLVTERGAALLLGALIIVEFALSLIISQWFFSLIFIGVVLALSYSIQPTRIKTSNEWVALGWMAFCRGFLPPLITWAAYGDIFAHDLPWKLGGFAFLWVFAFQATKDFADIAGDSYFNVPTLPTRFGVKESVRIITILSFLPFVFGIFTEMFWLLPLVPVAIIIIIGLKKDLTTEKFENNISWMLFYLGLGLITVLTLGDLVL